MRRCLKYLMLGPFGLGIYTVPEFDFSHPAKRIYRASFGYLTLTYWE